MPNFPFQRMRIDYLSLQAAPGFESHYSVTTCHTQSLLSSGTRRLSIVLALDWLRYHIHTVQGILVCYKRDELVTYVYVCSLPFTLFVCVHIERCLLYRCLVYICMYYFICKNSSKSKRATLGPCYSPCMKNQFHMSSKLNYPCKVTNFYMFMCVFMKVLHVKPSLDPR